ncbi:hypothetical protein I2F31_01985 [Acinetobacter sp. EC24]|nr:hypothetical protein [Acinetobacter rathckeae]MBF7694576.1 hypothetical protein [Acinetobacter rathckeae]
MVEDLVNGFKAPVYADHGYISHDFKEKLKLQGVDLVTYHRKNMQVIQLSKIDRHHLKQRNKIEHYLVTSKVRSIQGYLSGIYAYLCAYHICHVNKPTIQMVYASAYTGFGLYIISIASTEKPGLKKF